MSEHFLLELVVLTMLVIGVLFVVAQLWCWVDRRRKP